MGKNAAGLKQQKGERKKIEIPRDSDRGETHQRSENREIREEGGRGGSRSMKNVAG